MRWLSKSVDTLVATWCDESNEDIPDVVVIGSGYGGSVAALRAAKHGAKVLVLERGKEYLSGEFPDGLGSALGHARLERSDATHVNGYESGLFDIRVGTDIGALVGNALGGTSQINAGVVLRPDKRVFDKCDEAGRLWPQAVSDAELSPWYERADIEIGAETFTEVPMHVHDPDSDGPTRVIDIKPEKTARLDEMATRLGHKKPREMTVSFEAARLAAAFGAPATEPNDQPVLAWCNGCGDCVAGCNQNAKKTLTTTYLPRAKAAGAEIFTGVSVLHLSRDGDHWRIHFVATDFRKAHRDGIELRVHTLRAKNVVLAAGTFGSTEVLLRSKEQGGLKFSEQLGMRFSTNGDNLAFDHLLPQRVNGVGVGDSGCAEDGYAIGPTITGMIKLDHQTDVTQSVLIEDGAVPRAIAGLFHEMITTSAAVAQLESCGYRGLPDAGAQVAPVTDWASLSSRALSHTQTLLTMGHDRSMGRIRIKDDRLDISYCADESKRVADLQTARLNAGRQGDWLLQNPVLQPLPKGVRDVLSGPELAGGTFTVHPLGGCCMADDAKRGVVDDCGRVFMPTDAGGGFHTGLYVLDGSVVPTSLGVNPLLTITALAERAISKVLETDLRNLKKQASPTTLAPPPGIDKTRPAAVPRSVPVHFAEAMRGTDFCWKAPADHSTKAGKGNTEEACDAYLLLHLPIDSLEAFAADPLHRIAIPGPGLGPVAFDEEPLLPRLRLDRKLPEGSNPADRPELLAHLSVVGGSVNLLPVVRTRTWRRCDATIRALLTWLKERGAEELWQGLARRLVELLKRLVNWMKGLLKGGLSNSKESNNGPGLWTRIISLLKLARHASEERTMEYRLNLRDTTPTGTAPREYVLLGTKRVGYPASWSQLKKGFLPGGKLGRTNVWLAFGQMEVNVYEDNGQRVGGGTLTLDMVDMTRLHAPQIGMRANTPDALVALAGYPLWMFRLLIKTRLWDFRLPDYPENIPDELYLKRDEQKPTDPQLEQRWPGFPKVPDNEHDWPTPWPAFPGLRIRGQTERVKACEPVAFKVQRNRQSKEKDVELKLIRYRNSSQPVPSGRYEGVRQCKTLLMLNGFAQSTLGFVPQEHIRNFDDSKNDEPGLAEFFYEQGFDVWLFDYRTSSILEASKKACSMDDIAEFDIPGAVDLVIDTLRKENPNFGDNDLQIYACAHCVGAASLAMSLLGGYLHDEGKEYGKLAGVTFSQMQAFLVGSKTAQMRLQVGGILRDAMGIEYLRLSAAEREPTVLESVLDRLFASLPVDEGEHCPHEFDRFTPRPGICTCKRMSGTISRLLKHDRIKEETHDRLAVYFGRANTGLLVHGGRCVANERLVNADGQNVYVTDENIQAYLHIPVAILHGEENALFSVESAHRTLEQLGRVNPDFKPRDIIAKGFAHFDCTIGHGPIMHEQILDPLRKFYDDAWAWNADPSVIWSAPQTPLARRSHARAPLAGPVIGWTRRKPGSGEAAHLVRLWIEVDETLADKACAVVTRVGTSGPPQAWNVLRVPLETPWKGSPPDLNPFATRSLAVGQPYVAIGVADVEIPDTMLQGTQQPTIWMFGVHEFQWRARLDSGNRNDPTARANRSIAPPITLKEQPDFASQGGVPLGGHGRTTMTTGVGELDMPALDPHRPPLTLSEADCDDLIKVMEKEHRDGVARLVQANPRTLSRKKRLEPVKAGWLAQAKIHKAALLCGPEPVGLRFVASCCRYPGLGFEQIRSDASLNEIARKMDSGHLSPQFMLMLGDQIYADATAGLMDSPSVIEKLTLSTRRAFASKGFKVLTTQLPTYMVIDDHEIGDNWSTDATLFRRGYDEAEANAARLRDTALSTFAAYQWAHSPRNGTRSGFNYQFEGPASSFFVLDTRTQRRRYGPTPQICAPEQLTALRDWLDEHPDDVKFIVTGSVVAPGLSEYETADEVPVRAADTWQLAPQQRSELLEMVAACKSTHVVFISGDYHCSAIATLTFSGGRTAYAVVTPPLYAPLPAANVHPAEVLGHEIIGLAGGGTVTVESKSYQGNGFAEIQLEQSDTAKWLRVNLHTFNLDETGAAARVMFSRSLPLL